MDESDDEKLDNKDLMDTAPGEDDESENDDDLAEENQKAAAIDSDEESEEEGNFINPLLGPAGSKSKKEDDEWSSDDDRYDTRVVEKKEPGSKRALRTAEAKKFKSAADTLDGDDVRNFFNKGEIEVVAQTDPEPPKKRRKLNEDELPEGYSSMDSDDIAETRALAKKMLRKKFREQAITDSFTNSWANGDNDKELPDWFV